MRASRLDLPPPPHPGLALQRYLKQHDENKDSARALLKHIAGSEVPQVKGRQAPGDAGTQAYRSAFERWKGALDLQGAVFLEATTCSPMAIGLGNASPLENGLALHHTYGTPYLPGSALKGLLRRVAGHFGLNEQEQAVLLGEGPDPKRKTQGNAAYLVYWDGWLDPASSKPLQLDVITVHHREYYGTKGKVWPTDFDDPNPVAFLTVRPGVKFHIPITCPAENAPDWPHKAAEILKWGLENLGLGGKTNAGYGYFTVKLPEKPKGELELGLELLEGYRKRIAGIKPTNERGELDFFLRELADKPPALRKPTLEALKKHLQDWKVWKLSNSQHAKIQELLDL